MKFLRRALSSANAALSRRHFHEGRDPVARPFYPKLYNAEKSNESAGIRSPFSKIGSGGKAIEPSKVQDSIFQMFSGIEKAHDRSGAGLGLMAGLDDTYSSLTDGMEFKLKKAATFFDFDINEVTRDDYTIRPDVNFSAGMTYDTKDLDLEKPGVYKREKRRDLETTTKEVLRKADFRVPMLKTSKCLM